ncbi:translocon-associated protein subunit beta [Pelagophyceae sp. CCMP2097]|nr:translocon-associated protein subunit beta [Pelagophyceae sp. CCMP2097]
MCRSMSRMAFLLLLAGVASDDVAPAAAPVELLLVRKYLASPFPLVEGMSLTIAYEFHNVGDVAVEGLQLTDTFDADAFDVLEQTRPSETSLLPNETATCHATIVLKSAGLTEFPRAVVSYTIGGKPRSVTSSTPAPFDIVSAGAHLRATSYYIKEWVLYFVATSPPILFPGLYYLKHRA